MKYAWALDVGQKPIEPYYDPQKIYVPRETWLDGVFKFMDKIKDMEPAVAIAFLFLLAFCAWLFSEYWKSERSNKLTDWFDKKILRKKDAGGS